MLQKQHMSSRIIYFPAQQHNGRLHFRRGTRRKVRGVVGRLLYSFQRKRAKEKQRQSCTEHAEDNQHKERADGRKEKREDAATPSIHAMEVPEYASKWK
jgi:hypothetical protein